jgi:tripartite motif-containing protein 71
MNKRLFFLIPILLMSLLVACGGNRSSTAPQTVTGSLSTSASSPTPQPGLILACIFSVALDKQGNLYVGDLGRLLKLSSSGQMLVQWHPVQPPSLPSGIAVDAQGSIYLTVLEDDHVRKLSPTGQILASWGGRGSQPGQFNNAADVAVDAQGNVYVTDFKNGRIQKFSSAGKLLAVLGTGQLDQPWGIGVDAQGNLYVADTARIVKFSSTGKLLMELRTTGGDAGLFSRPMGLDVDRQGNVYLADTRNNRVVEFSPTGQFLTQWKGVVRPTSVAVDTQGDVYVVEGAYYSEGLVKLSHTGQILATWKQRTDVTCG